MKITAMYFSATETTRKIVTSIAAGISKNIKGTDNINIIDFTTPPKREKRQRFHSDDVVIIGVPVYAGRVPNVLLKYLNSMTGDGAIAIAIVVYGNRHYDDALIELKDILLAGNFRVVAGGAFIGEHSFSTILAQGRPDVRDMEFVMDFVKQVSGKLKNSHLCSSIFIPGNRHYRSYYMPQNEKKELVDIRRVLPKTDDACINCKLCVSICPMGSIKNKDVKEIDGICIKCGACIKKCPVGAKYYDDEDYLRHKRELEEKYKDRKKPKFFL